MANQRGEVQVYLGGKLHDLVFTMNTIADIEEILGGQSFSSAFERGDIGVRSLRAAITAGIWNADRNAQARRKLRRLWSVDKIGALMSMDDMGQYTIAIVTGLLRFQGKTEAEIEVILSDDDDDTDDDTPADDTEEKDLGEAKAEAPSGTGQTSSAAPVASASTAKPSGDSPLENSSTPRPAITST